MVVHTGDTPYICHLCGAVFKHAGSLHYHTKTHSKVKTERKKAYECDLCPEAFSNKKMLKKHRRSHQVENIQAAPGAISTNSNVNTEFSTVLNQFPHTTCSSQFLTGSPPFSNQNLTFPYISPYIPNANPYVPNPNSLFSYGELDPGLPEFKIEQPESSSQI